jgi:hypothetical protein
MVSPAIKLGTWSVYTYSAIKVAQRGENPFTWSSSLWFGTYGISQDLRWHQLSFMDSPLIRKRRAYEPFSADPNSREAQAAFSGGLDIVQLAETPRPIDMEDFDDFADEWIERFAMAAKGVLRYPQRLPLNPK